MMLGRMRAAIQTPTVTVIDSRLLGAADDGPTVVLFPVHVSEDGPTVGLFPVHVSEDVSLQSIASSVVLEEDTS